MAGAIGLGDVGIILRPLIDILDHQADRGARRLAVEHARQDAHLIGLAPLRCEARGAGAALVEPRLDRGLIDCDPRRAPVDHRADRGTVAFAPGGEAEQMAKTVDAHAGICPKKRQS